MKLVCDAPAADSPVTYYTIVGLGDPIEVPRKLDDAGMPASDFGFEYDISHLDPGTYNIMVSACSETECSIEVPFDLTRPPRPAAPTGLRVL